MKTDLEIQNDVIAELKWEPFITASEIGVAVKNGVVTLSGTVDSYLKKTTAEKAAKRVKGVKAVAEDIEVKTTGSLTKNDTQIAEAVLNALKWHSAIKEDKIKIKVEDGVVTLEGEVEWEFQKNSAQSMIEDLIGVRRIINKIHIKTTPPVKDIKERISEALIRSATIDSEKIRIDTEGNKVILKGTVRSWAEKIDAEDAAWCAPGVSTVDNQLEVKSEVFAY